MKKARKKFVALRISVLSLPLPIFSKEKLQPEQVIDYIQGIFTEETRFKPEGKPFFLVFGDFLFSRTGELIAFRLGKEKEPTLPQYDESQKTFVDRSIPVSPYIVCIFAKPQQCILVEYNPRVFRISRLVESLESYLNHFVNRKFATVRIRIEPITSKLSFWETVDSYESIYSADFALIPPNFFDGPKDIKEMLSDVKESYNLEEMKFGMTNKSGNLKLDKQDPWISNINEWIGQGGGYWKVVCSKKGGRKFTVSSRDQTRKIEIEIENYTPEEIEYIIKTVEHLILFGD